MDRDPPDRENSRDVALPRLTEWEGAIRKAEFGMDRDPPDRENSRDVALPRLTEWEGAIRKAEFGRRGWQRRDKSRLRFIPSYKIGGFCRFRDPEDHGPILPLGLITFPGQEIRGKVTVTRVPAGVPSE